MSVHYNTDLNNVNISTWFNMHMCMHMHMYVTCLHQNSSPLDLPTLFLCQRYGCPPLAEAAAARFLPTPRLPANP